MHTKAAGGRVAAVIIHDLLDDMQGSRRRCAGWQINSSCRCRDRSVEGQDPSKYVSASTRGYGVIVEECAYEVCASAECRCVGRPENIARGSAVVQKDTHPGGRGIGADRSEDVGATAAQCYGACLRKRTSATVHAWSVCARRTMG